MNKFACHYSILISVSILIALSVNFSYAGAVTYQWPQTPLEIDLEVGVEQNIHIPAASNIRLGIPKEINQKLTPQIISNQLWLTASEAFDSSRVIVIAEPLGRLILHIRAGTAEISNQPIIIQPKASVEPLHSEKELPLHGYVTLTRWVIHQFYAPERLLKPLPGIVRVSVDKKTVNIFRCGARIPTACAGALVSSPLASWRSSHHYVTALEINNNLSESIILDPRELRGSWRTAAFLHTQLHPKGQIGDSTVLVLISDLPFENPSL